MQLGDLERSMLLRLHGLLEQELGKRLLSFKAFGSRARGEARPSSDLDVLVLLDRYDRVTRKKILGLAEDVNEEFNWAILLSPLVMDVVEYERLKARERRLVRDIETEGIPV